MLNRSTLLPLLVIFLVTACDQPAPDTSARTADTAAPSAAPSSNTVADNWIGRWTGPEGTYLEIAPSGSTYQIHIRNLDGVRTFKGVASGSTIGFVRDEASETIKAGSGADTGMKWLTDKTDCLVIKPGEGYCHD